MKLKEKLTKEFGRDFFVAHLGAWIAGAVVDLSSTGQTRIVSAEPVDPAGSIVLPAPRKGAVTKLMLGLLPASLLARWYGCPQGLHTAAIQVTADHAISH
mgnify:CR=1 FL=1